MSTKSMCLALALAAVGAMTGLAQEGQPADPQRTPGVQAGNDPKYREFVMANCKTPPPPPAPRGGGPGGGGGRAGGPPQPVTASENYTIAAIPGVVAQGARWRLLWEDMGNNADGPVWFNDGLHVAQNDRSQVQKIDLNGRATVVYNNTFTGGSLAANANGQVFIAERALNQAIWLLEPERRLFTNTFNGEPLDCTGPGVLNDMIADGKGGVYFTKGGVYYANPQGVVMGRFGTVGGNGIILSPDQKTLYVTGRLQGATPPAGVEGNGGLVAFDVQADGSLTNERQFAWVGGDGSAVDSQGRIYTTGAGVVSVVSPQGQVIGTIATPRPLISVTFGGPDRKTLFGVAIRDVQIFALPMLAEGVGGRPK